MATIFISHSSRNNPQAIAIRDWLIDEGWNDIFLDLDPERGLKAGERWQEALKRASSTCELVIFLISPAWAASKWCLAEFLLAKQMNKLTFAVIVEETPFEEIPTELSSEWQIVDLATGSPRRSFDISDGDGTQSETVSFGEDGLQRLKIGLLHSGLDPKYFPWPPEHDPDRSPYRGLRALEEEDAGIFFGREGPIVDGLDIVRGQRNAAPPRMLVILGASGAGKSSFMRAGLLPRLRRDSQHYRVLPVLRPNNAALEGEHGFVAALGTALRDAGSSRARAEIRTAVQAGAASVADLLSPLIQTSEDAHPKPLLVLPIDQGEELFLADGETEAQAFLGLLRDLLLLDSPSFSVLVTIRSDSYEPLQVSKALEGVAQKTYSLPPMPRGAHGEVILGPARRLSEASRPFQVEPALVDALLGDLENSDAKDALPLLAFTLDRLFREYGESGELTKDGYKATGRIRGAIEAAVKEALRAADRDPDVPRDMDERLRLLRSAMIPALASVDPETHTPRRRVARFEEVPKAARPLLGHLVDQRLLSTDVSLDSGERTVEPAHEALLRQWDALSGWLAEDSEDLTMAERVRRAARDWEENDRDPAWLVHSGARLQLADRVAAREDFVRLFGARSKTYLLACREAEQARQAEEEAVRLREIAAQRQRVRIVAAGLVASLVLLAIAGWQWWEAGQQRQTAEAEARRARHAAAGGLAALSTIETDQGNYTKATKLALAAWPRNGRTDDPKLDDVLDNLSTTIPALIDGVETRETKRNTGSGRVRVEFPSNSDIAVIARGDRLKLVDITSEEVVSNEMGPLNPYGEGFDISPDGQWLAVAFQDAPPTLVSTKNPSEVRRIRTRSPVSGFGFSADGTKLAIIERRGTVSVVELQRLTAVRQFQIARGLADSVWDIAVSPAMDRFAVATSDSVLLFDIEDPSRPLAQKKGVKRGSLNWVSENGILAVDRQRQALFINWDRDSILKIGGAAHSLSPARNEVAVRMAVDPPKSSGGGHTTLDDGFKVLTVASGVESRSLDYTPDGNGLLFGDARSAVWHWRFADNQMVARYDNGHAHVAGATMQSDGKVSVAFENGELRSVPADDATVRLIGKPFPEETETALSPDGSRVVGRHADGTVEVRAVSDIDTVLTTAKPSMPQRSGPIALSPNGSRIAFATPEGVTTYALDETELSWTMQRLEFGRFLPRLTYSPDGKLIAGAAGDRYDWVSFLLNGDSGEILSFQNGTGPIGAFASPIEFSSDGTHVRYFQQAEWRTIGAESSAGEIEASFDTRWSGHSLSVDGSRAALVNRDRKGIEIWDTTTSVRLQNLQGLGPEIAEIVFLPDGFRLVSLNSDGSLAIWQLPPEIRQGNAFQIACEVLPHADLEEASSGYPIRIDEPICAPDYDPPLP